MLMLVLAIIDVLGAIEVVLAHTVCTFGAEATIRAKIVIRFPTRAARGIGELFACLDAKSCRAWLRVAQPRAASTR